MKIAEKPSVKMSNLMDAKIAGGVQCASGFPSFNY
jgi:hypothetical protein